MSRVLVKRIKRLLKDGFCIVQEPSFRGSTDSDNYYSKSCSNLFLFSGRLGYQTNESLYHLK